jgi:hypothetical protein
VVPSVGDFYAVGDSEIVSTTESTSTWDMSIDGNRHSKLEEFQIRFVDSYSPIFPTHVDSRLWNQEKRQQNWTHIVNCGHDGAVKVTSGS